MSYLIRSFSVYLKSIRELGSVFVIAWGYRAGWWGIGREGAKPVV